MVVTAENRKGFPCPACGSHMAVHDSRQETVRGHRTVRRRRVCGCGKKVNTFEVEMHAIRSSRFLQKIAITAKENPALRDLFARIMEIDENETER